MPVRNDFTAGEFCWIDLNVPRRGAFELPEDPIDGAASVHHVFKRWMAEINAGKVSAPWTVPERPGKTPVPAREI